jgi:transketolase
MEQIKTMRDAFLEELYLRMKDDSDIFFISADMGAPMLDRLRVDFSERFINVGIAEQNLVNIAAGLGLEGFTVYGYAIAPFLLRAFEQIRINLSLSSQIREIDVNLIGVGGGVSYDVSGPTHHCLEDLTVMRSLPNLMVFSPSDWFLAQKFVDFSIQNRKPKYLRFDGKPLKRIYNEEDDIDFLRGFTELKKGENVCIVSTGFSTHIALSMTEKNCHLDLGVIDFYELKYPDQALFANILKNYKTVVTIEEAFINKGGLDSLVSSILSQERLDVSHIRLGFRDDYIFRFGSRDFLYRMSEIDEDSIMKLITAL